MRSRHHSYGDVGLYFNDVGTRRCAAAEGSRATSRWWGQLCFVRGWNDHSSGQCLNISGLSMVQASRRGSLNYGCLVSDPAPCNMPEKEAEDGQSASASASYKGDGMEFQARHFGLAELQRF